MRVILSLFLAISLTLVCTERTSASGLCDSVLLGNLKSYYKATQAWTKQWVDSHPDGEAWIVDGRKSPYNDFFKPVFYPQETFESWVKLRKTQKKSTHVADFFGSGVFLESLDDIDTVSGIRLVPLKREELPRGYPNAKWNEVIGDLYSNTTWNALRKDMQARGISSFDLIVSRPAGGLSQNNVASGARVSIEAHMVSMLVLARRAYRLLSRDGGEMFLQIPREVQRSSEFRVWLADLNARGVLTQAAGAVVRIVRRVGGPEEL